MLLRETQEGDYRIFVGAMEAPRGDGYIAALIVNRVRNRPAAATARAEAYRDDSLACGHRWPTAEEALHYATHRARQLIRSRSTMLMC